MRVLALDTATTDTVVGALEGQLLVHESVTGAGADGRPAHSTRLLREVEAAATALGGWGAVERIGAGVGPGSFTGIRIGLATARALAQARSLPLVPIPTPGALAEGAGGEGVRLAVLDARRGEVFVGVYGDGETLLEPRVAAPDQIARIVDRLDPVLAVGDGAVRYRGELERAGMEVPPDDDPRHHLSPEAICRLTVEGDPVVLREALPNYLRRPDAERWRERTAQGKGG